MSTTTMKGQFLQGKVQGMKRPSKHKIVNFDNDMPRIDGIYKASGRTLPKLGAI